MIKLFFIDTVIQEDLCYVLYTMTEKHGGSGG